MIHAHSQPITDIALFEQHGGWVFLVSRHDRGFSGDLMGSGKRGSLEHAIEAARRIAGKNSKFVYCII